MYTVPSSGYFLLLPLMCCADCIFRGAVTLRVKVPRGKHLGLRKRSKCEDCGEPCGICNIIVSFIT